PALGEDRLLDLTPPVRPVLDAVGGVDQLGEGDGAVEGDPAHQLRVHEVARLAPHLPDPLVLVLPAMAGGVGEVDEERAALGLELRDELREPGGGVEQLAVDVDLALGPRTVPDPDRRAPTPA